MSAKPKRCSIERSGSVFSVILAMALMCCASNSSGCAEGEKKRRFITVPGDKLYPPVAQLGGRRLAILPAGDSADKTAAADEAADVLIELLIKNKPMYLRDLVQWDVWPCPSALLHGWEEKNPKVLVVTRSELARVLDERDLQAALDMDTASRAGRLLGADYVLILHMREFEFASWIDSWEAQVTFKLLDVSSGTVAWTFVGKCLGRDHDPREMVLRQVAGFCYVKLRWCPKLNLKRVDW